MNRLLQRLAALLLLVTVATAPALAAGPAPELVPLRLVAEAAGARLLWDGATQTITLTARDGAVAVVRIGESTAMVDGQEVPIGATVANVDGRAMIAAAFMNSFLGLPVHYNAKYDTASVDPRMELALAFARGLVTGTAAELQEQFTPALQAVMTPEAVAAGATAYAALGKPGRPQVIGQNYTGVHASIDVAMPLAKLPLKVTVRFAADGRVDDFLLMPLQVSLAASAPAYADRRSFIEKEVVIGEEPWQLPGTLTLPIAKGPFPVVVLVHGSGPNDRDESVYGVKVFRDLAHGLASRGIAVLRYDKRTFEHSAKFSAIPKYTIQQETVDDALAAVKYLAGQEGIDPQRVFVLGHSLGGLALPRILEQDTAGQIRGGIMMAAPNSFYDTMIKQNELLAQMGAVPPQQVDMITQQFAMLRDPSFNPEQPPEGYLLGMPYYWLDVAPKSSDLLKGQTQPVLVLQGQRDFQVPVSELESLQADLAERTNIAYKLYPKLNHLFTEGEGAMSSLKEYMTPANVPVYVTEDIAAWIKAQ